MILLHDISGVVYRSAHKLKLTAGQQSTGVIFGVMNSLSSLCRQLQPTQLVICFDAGRAARIALYPEYKANRKRDPEFQEAIHHQIDQLKKIFQLLPFISVTQEGVEADDVIGVLTQHLTGSMGQRVGIVTGDQDLHQLVSRRSRIVAYDGTPVTPSLKPAQIVAFKVLVGDSSDNIKGVQGLGKVTANRLLAEHHSLKNIVAWARQGNKLGRMTLDEALPIIRRNLNLIRLDGRLFSDDQIPAIIESYEQQAGCDRFVNDEALDAVFRDLKFNSLVQRFENFLAPFRDLEVEHGKEN